jgi:hypothetical protein
MYDYKVKTQKQWDNNHVDMNPHKINQIKKWNEDEIITDKKRLQKITDWKLFGKRMRENMHSTEKEMFSLILFPNNFQSVIFCNLFLSVIISSSFHFLI